VVLYSVLLGVVWAVDGGRWSLACFGRLAIGLVFGIRGVVFGIVIVVEVVVVIVSGWKKTVMKK